MEDFFEDPYRNQEDIGNEDQFMDMNHNEEDDKVILDLEKLAKGAKKKHILRPRPKLDLERLKSSKGLISLADSFKKVKFNGGGFEYNDLNTLMMVCQHWAHRLMPNIIFAEFLDRMEKLGTKKETQTLIKRIRLDMFLHEEQEIHDENILSTKSTDEDEGDNNMYNLDYIFGPKIPNTSILHHSGTSFSKNSNNTTLDDANYKTYRSFEHLINDSSLDETVKKRKTINFYNTKDDECSTYNVSNNTTSVETGKDKNNINIYINNITNSENICNIDQAHSNANNPISTLTCNETLTILTPESEESIKDRIERKRLLALEKRALRLSNSFI